MQKKEIFIIGCKILSIYCFVTGIPLFFSAIATFFNTTEIPSDLQTAYLITNMGLRATPIFLVFIGYFLLKKSDKLYNYLIGEKNTEASFLDQWLQIVIRGCGIFIIVDYFPNFTYVISNFFASKVVTPAYALFQEVTTLQDVMSTFSAIAIGIYLLLDGRIFLKLGNKKSC